MKIRNLLNGGVSEIGDADAEVLLASGYWAIDGAVEPVVRMTRARKAPVQEPKSEE